MENTLRNQNMLEYKKDLKVKKTGTTIVGVVVDGAVILGADTRATTSYIADKNCDKIHYIEPNIYCCGAGTAADNEYIAK